MRVAKNNKRGLSKNALADAVIGKRLNFASAEAYKLLRTNLFFCVQLEDGRSCPVIGITSSIQGEGKSTTSINLSYMLAEDGKNVCLIEGDMRAPALKSRLGLNQVYGLSKVLSGIEMSDECLETALHKNLKVLIAGAIPPNPAELLGSKRMKQLVESLEERFDYVIVDLPPVTVVADALAVSEVLDGLIVVVEEGVTTKRSLANTMQRLDVVNDKILGFVVTHAETGKNKYGKKKYGKYGYGYGYGYGHSHREQEGE